MLPYLQLRFSAPYFSHSCAANNFLCPSFNCMVVVMNCQQNMVHWSHHISASRYWSHSFPTFSSFSWPHSLGVLQMSVGTDETSDFRQCESIVNMEQILSHDVQAIDTNDSSKSSSFEDYKERQRREKIGLANKGRIPWNKGKKHSEETRERIKQRTIEALQNPKVRKRMSECPRSRSDHIKKKIGSSLRRLWGKRLKWKRSKEDFFRSWSESIAEAAKVGGNDEQVLDWDSYDRKKQELVLQQLQLAAEKEMGKEMKKIVRAEKRLQRRLKKMERLGGRKSHEKANDQQHKAKVKTDKDNLIVLEELSLKQRLRKIREKEVSTNGEVTRKGVPVITPVTALEKLDIELIKRERRQIRVSFADEIRDAKNKKAEFIATIETESLSNAHPSF